MKARRKTHSRLRKAVRRGIRWIERSLAIVGLAAVLYHAGFDVSRVTSGSMSPTLEGHDVDTGDVIVTEKVSYMLRRPRRWEIVTFLTNDGTQVMKRVVGLPGETVAMEAREPIIDGVPHHLPKDLHGVEYWALGNLYANRTVECGNGYYVLGDNARDSQDSRFDGPVAPERLRGRAWLRVWPLYKFGWITPQVQQTGHEAGPT